MRTITIATLLIVVWSFRLLWFVARLTWWLLWWLCYLIGSIIEWSVRTIIDSLRLVVLGLGERR